ncbi:hypothetical protein P175DRAFT_0534132 [Aspergillus ochraceoroseus IBT 24754]|uniref:Hydrophobin n=1 Tax=Aspergillus ochraceoroseus IBT 24754 TaxID=1392256 RepID=A0A2T5LTS5_9EURO|nr:uncharacterized protein P175DRAFT_0534132 [Aspergillus ochraceoroseus IBT 24754]PTU19679.1 hypothetical protein P175DRAFT_0534132 [Aspergillus ochraceoroseus IBT 24754]
MKFFAVAALFATAAIAMPHEPSYTAVDQTQNICGKAQLSCCNALDSSAHVSKDEENDLLALLGEGLLNNGGVLGKYHGCSPLVSLVGNIGEQCDNHVACCNDVSSNNNGVVNVVVPCLPVNVL